MTTVLEAVNGAFESLFFGAGSWLGILLSLSIILGLLLKWKYTGVLLLPITVFWGIEYIGKDLGWQAIIMFSTAIFVVAYMMKQLKRG